jgi:hypothetical protein
MSVGLAVTIAVLCLIVALGIAWAWRRAARQSRIFRRLAPALVEWDAFEKLLADRTDQSHFLERHGPMTYEEEQRGRALTGILAAAGVDGHPVDAGRWRTHEDLRCALDYAHAQWAAGVRPPRGVFRLRFAEAIGDGFAAGSETRAATAHALVIVRKGLAITAFPVVAPDASVAWEPVQTSRASGMV